MPIPPVLRSLLTATGPSGYETAPAAVWREAAGAFAEVTTDVMGSSTARVKGTGGGPTMAIVGHIDEIGLIVTHIDDDGFLRFAGVGGWDTQILVGQRVELATRDGVVPGVIGKKPIHLLKDDERKKVAELKDLHIDIGAADGDEARGRVRVGDVAVIAAEPVDYPNGRAVSRSMDNRLGCYVAYEAARLVADAGGAPGDVVAVAAVQEETTFGGAATTAFSLKPDLAVVVDVTHATDAPGIDVNELGSHPFGSGPVIERGIEPQPARLRAPARHGRGGGHPVHGRRLRPPHRHRRRRDAPQRPRRAVRVDRPAAALHALAGRDGRPGRRRCGRTAHRGGRAAPRRGRELPALAHRERLAVARCSQKWCICRQFLDPMSGGAR